MERRKKDPRWTQLQMKCRELRLQGMTYADIADKLGKRREDIRKTCIRIGMPCTEEEIQRAFADGHKKLQYTDEDINRMLRENEQDFELVKAYGNSDGYVDLRCLWCGNITRKSTQQVRKKRNIQCDHCKQGAEWEQIQKDVETISKRFETYKRIERNKVKRPSYLKECKHCGKLFWTHDSHVVNCSKECTKKEINKGADDRLNKSNIIDRDITLEKLFNRENGKCYLCGGECDWEDYVVRDGNYIVGDNYPSIDHVIPLAKGGKHEWENVRLAHKKCNTVKRDRLPPSVF